MDYYWFANQDQILFHGVSSVYLCSFCLQVAAINALGIGKFTKQAHWTPGELRNAAVFISFAVARAPFPPQVVEAFAGPKGSYSALVGFLPPFLDGGVPVLNYTVTSTPATHAFVVNSSVTNVTVTGLDGVSVYYFAVVAANEVGYSQPTLSGPVDCKFSCLFPLTCCDSQSDSQTHHHHHPRHRHQHEFWLSDQEQPSGLDRFGCGYSPRVSGVACGDNTGGETKIISGQD